MYKAREKVFWFAILSRIFIFILQMIFNAICPDHDADAFRSPLDPDEKYSHLDKVFNFMFSGLTRWDAQYYIHIAKYGYTYENTLAFFPLFPMMMKHIAGIFKINPPILVYSNLIIMCGFVINFICFIKAALILYDLGCTVFKDKKVAYRAAIFFCINPASIFFSAIYTESMFAYLTYYTMLSTFKNNSWVFLPLGLSSIVRSNGLINLGFPLYNWVKNLITSVITYNNSECKTSYGNEKSVVLRLRCIFFNCLKMFVILILAILPFYYLQVYNYINFCKLKVNNTFPVYIQEYARNNNLLLIGQHEFLWCNFKLPMSYSYIQNTYWNVGFLKYYQVKQIPNFLLALPILYLVLRCSYDFFKEHKRKFLTMEIFVGISDKTEKEKYPLDMFVFVVHGLFLTIFCIFFVHIQVSTRLLCSASPLIYWYCALVTLPNTKKSKGIEQFDYESPENVFSKCHVFFITQEEYTTAEKWIIAYFISYFIAGSFLFSNFLPWT